MENRNGLVAAAEATLATGTAEREAAAACQGPRRFRPRQAAYNIVRLPKLLAPRGEARPAT